MARGEISFRGQIAFVPFALLLPCSEPLTSAPGEVVDVLRGGAHGKNTMVRKHAAMDLMVTLRA